MSALKTTLNGYVGYRGREGQLSFLLHRLTGLGTLLFLFIHILDTSTVYFFPNLYAHAIAIYRLVPFEIGEITLVFSVLYHGANGLRIAFFDFFPKYWKKEYSRNWVWITLIIAVILWLPLAGVMGFNILKYNFGMFGG